MSQTRRMYNLFLDAQDHRTDEIQAKVYGSDKKGCARIGARVDDIVKRYDAKFADDRILPNGKVMHCRPDKDNPGLWWYRMISSVDMNNEQKPAKIFDFDEVRRLLLFTELAWDVKYRDLVDRIRTKKLTDVDKKWIVDKFNERRAA